MAQFNNGIPVRTIVGEENVQQDDFEEEKEGRRGIFTPKTDGFTFRQGSDIISYMDKRGSFHPRRYVVTMDNGCGTATVDSCTPVDIIICEDGPRITLSFPNFGPVSSSQGDNALVRNINSNLPMRICPDVERPAFAVLNAILGAATTTSLVTFSLLNDGTFAFNLTGGVVGYPNQFTALSFTVVYDTGNY